MRLWEDNDVSKKRASGLLLESIASPSRATNPQYAGGESRFVKLLTSGGQHIGTLHEIVMPDGSVPHSHPKDYTLRDCRRVREPEKG